jgi:hypothetical protein
MSRTYSLKSPLKIQRGGADFLDMNNIEYVWKNFIVTNLQEQIRILPDSIIFGSLFIALLTQSYSTVMFAVAMLEAGIAGGLLQAIFTYLDILHTAPANPDKPSSCVSGYTTPTLETLFSICKDKLCSGKISSGVPSYPVYFLATAISYVVGSMYTQKQELEALGPAYAARFYIALFASFLLLVLVTFYRLANGCDSLGILVFTLLFGFLIGIGLVYQNTYLFGRDSTNLTGIPLLRERTRDGKPLYICPQKTGSV